MQERKESSSFNFGNWLSARKHLVEFFGNRHIRMVDINKELLQALIQHLLMEHDGTHGRKKKLGRNSALSYFTKIRVVINEAYNDGYLQTKLTLLK